VAKLGTNIFTAQVVLFGSAVRPQVSDSTGRSSPAPDGGFADPEGRFGYGRGTTFLPGDN